MGVNDGLTINQAATVFNAVVAQATGNSALAVVDTASFVSTAQTLLRTGYDPILNAVSQVISRTIFSVRPYSAKFKGLRVTEEGFGAMVRKLSVADGTLDDDLGFKYPVAYEQSQEPPEGNGKSVDMYGIKKQKVLQTNFYGQNVWQDHFTIFEKQFKPSFRGPQEFGQFVSMLMQNATDKVETARESVSRSLVANFIGALSAEANATRVVHLLTEYNAKTGQELTATDIYKEANFKPFMQWVSARINSISKLFTERSSMFQTVVNDNNILRHTPKADQRLYLFAQSMQENESMVLAEMFSPEKMSFGDYEEVNFWQSIQKPDSLRVTPSYIHTDGTAKKGTEQNLSNVFGLLCDRNAMSFAEFDYSMAPTPFNVAGRYVNFWMNSTFKFLSDNTEKGVIFLLD